MTTTTAILWDNDGVLVETEHLYFEATRDTVRSAGLELTQDLYLEHFLVNGRGAWHLLEARGVPADRIEALKAERNARYARRLADAPRVVPGIPDVLDALHGRYVMGIVTSCRREHFEVIHRATGLLKYFDFVLAHGDYARSKPAPDPYLRAVERAGVPAGDCIAVEDSERGLIAATAAGVRCVVIPSWLTRSCRFAGAWRVLESAREVPALLTAAGRT
jgi:HAD superfamily hydrolase (TIGR01509 family)